MPILSVESKLSVLYKIVSSDTFVIYRLLYVCTFRMSKRQK